MKTLKTFSQICFSALLMLSFMVWTMLPLTTHSPSFVETLQEHVQMIEDHGHSHELIEDLLWDRHGHNHDVTDHDHNPAMLVLGVSQEPMLTLREMKHFLLSSNGSSQIFRIDRPPRV